MAAKRTFEHKGSGAQTLDAAATVSPAWSRAIIKDGQAKVKLGQVQALIFYLAGQLFPLQINSAWGVLIAWEIGKDMDAEEETIPDMALARRRAKEAAFCKKKEKKKKKREKKNSGLGRSVFKAAVRQKSF